MPHDSDINALMMDFLYGELSDTDAEAFRARVLGDPKLEAELEALSQTRAAFKSMPVEEPPPALSAQLLHEAAKRAPARKRAHTIDERPGLFETVAALFRPVWQHPAAASVAALMLVAGVAGALYLRGVDSPAHPTASTAAEAPEGPPASRAASRELNGLAAADKDVTLEAPGYFARDGEGGDDLGTADTIALDPAPAAGAATPADRWDSNLEKSTEGRRRAELAQPEQERLLRESKQSRNKDEEEQDFSMRFKNDRGDSGGKGVAAKPRPKEPMANAVSGADPLIVLDGAEQELESKPERQRAQDNRKTGPEPKTEIVGGAKKSGSVDATRSKAPPPRESPRKSMDDDMAPAEDAPVQRGAGSAAVTRSTTQSSGGSSAYRVYRDKRADREAKELQGKLHSVLDNSKLSKTKRCSEAAKIANDILDRNPEYYSAKVEDSKRLSPCEWQVQNERKSRSKRRAEAKRAKAKKAAPAESDDAAAAEATE
jgi:hypothetical protein